jgi:hypothetical protein
MSDSTIPAPPEGFITLDTGSAVGELPRPTRIRGVAQPMHGVLVWAEGAWKPVVGFRKRFTRSVEVYYAESSKRTASPEGQFMQRLAPERIAVRPELIPQHLHFREQQAQAGRRVAEVVKAADAERGEGIVARRPKPPATLASAERSLAVAREMVVERRRAVAAAHEQLAAGEEGVLAMEAHVAELRRRYAAQPWPDALGPDPFTTPENGDPVLVDQDDRAGAIVARLPMPDELRPEVRRVLARALTDSFLAGAGVDVTAEGEDPIGPALAEAYRVVHATLDEQPVDAFRLSRCSDQLAEALRAVGSSGAEALDD